MSGITNERMKTAIDDWMAVKDGRKSRWHELFGTPERAAKTMMKSVPMSCIYCELYSTCGGGKGKDCLRRDYDALLEWLRGDA